MRNRLLWGIGLLMMVGGWLAIVSDTAAQESEPEAIEFMTVELWPDYDQPELLVILTAALPVDTPLPTTLSMPVPDEATINAVARITPDQQLIDDVSFRRESGQIKLVMPNAAVRVEYYLPYTAVTDERTLPFQWTAPLPVERLSVTVQQPRYAEQFSVSAEVAQIQETAEGVRYHLLPEMRRASGEAVDLTINYTLPNGRLTASAVDTAATDASSWRARLQAAWQNNRQLWLLGGGMLVLSIILIVQGIREKRSGREEQKGTLLCSHCEYANQPQDKFCRGCGRRL